MTSLLSKLVDNLAEAIHKIKCKYEHDKKTCTIKYTDCERCLEYKNVKNGLIAYICLLHNRNCQKSLTKI